MDEHERTTCWILLGAVLAGMLNGCALGPDFHRPKPPGSAGFLPGNQPEATVAAAASCFKAM